MPERRTTVFKKRLGDLNYEVKDLGLIDLAKDVPDDATIVVACSRRRSRSSRPSGPRSIATSTRAAAC